ncbi:capsule assembly Wzi family protein [Pseudoalteromonas sp. T1lg23B]|uniref:capsule assembly Wzi family protein n=1 Tax=Pseudoalteromonas sp. T1lg23B TaxID=2077097 RepID=UPI000CF737E3|nr:capsule assembly Wzi family protein [Pseudoalteromonas sp. T1lg23B]
MSLKLSSCVAAFALVFSCFSFSAPTAYLPIGKDTILEYQIDRMFALTQGVPMAKPYRLSEINIALQKLRGIDAQLYSHIRERLKKYQGKDEIVRQGVKLRYDSGTEVKLANDRNNSASEYAEISLDGVWRGSDNTLLQMGMDYRVRQGDLVLYNTFYALAGDTFQLNLGYKEHWFSPFKSFAQVYSNNAKPAASVSLGLIAPLNNWWNLDFELFYSELDRVEKGIVYQGQLHDGSPKLAGTHLSIEPIEGWKIGLNRMMQFGGGPREVSGSDVLKAYFDPAGNDNKGNGVSQDSELGDQWATLTSTLQTNFYTPIEWYLEYGGEDTKNHSNYQFGNTVASFGVYLPQLSKTTTLRYEYTNMHSLWYVNEIYPTAGNTYKGFVVGHFAADQRVFGDAAPSKVHTLEATYSSDHSTMWRFKYTQVDNESGYVNEFNQVGANYEQARALELSNSRVIEGRQIETTLSVGKDVFGESYTWLSLNVYW